MSAPSHAPAILLSVKVGKMVRSDKKLKPEPEQRKGTLEFVLQNDVVKMYWKLRPGNTIVDTLIVERGKAVVKKISDENSSYIFRIKSEGKDFFYWVQEPNTTKATFDDMLDKIEKILTYTVEELRQLAESVGLSCW